MNGMKHLSLIGLIATDEQTREWMAAARTPETRARIRRWSRIESVAAVIMLAGIALLVVAPFASIAAAVWDAITDMERIHLHWWIWGTTIGALAVGTVGFLLGTSRRERACFADGQTAVGVVERAIEHPGSGDDLTWFDLRISAALADGTRLHRRLHLEGEHLDRKLGRSVRFRHNTRDPDALDDVQLDGWPDHEAKGW